MDSKTFIIDLIDKQMNAVLETFCFDADFIKILKAHNHEIIVKFPVILDDGSTEIFNWFFESKNRFWKHG